MTKSLSVILCLVLTYPCIAQKVNDWTEENFEQQVLKYDTQQAANATKKQKNYAGMILDEVRSSTDTNPAEFIMPDYFNVLSAMLTLNEDERIVQLAYDKFESAEGSCEYFMAFADKVRDSDKYAQVRKSFVERAAECAKNAPKQEVFDPTTYSTKEGLELKLVQQLHEIDQSDQEYRSDDNPDVETRSKQRRIDELNQKKIDELFAYYGRYIGNSLAGPKLDHVMWAVIQHSNPDYMKKYLPVVVKAVQMNELDESALKMLIDRYYGFTEGYQIFGSQRGFGFELADEKKQAEIKAMYGID